MDYFGKYFVNLNIILEGLTNTTKDSAIEADDFERAGKAADTDTKPHAEK